MKNIAYLFFLLFFYSGTQAQLHDKTWLTGYGANWQPDSVFGNIRFTFSDTGVVIKRDSLGMNFDRGSSTTGRICGNSTQNTYTGLLFKGTSTETKIISNQIRTHSYGLWVRDGAISPQGVDSANHRNQWTAASYPQRAALHYDPSQAEFQYFFIQVD